MPAASSTRKAYTVSGGLHGVGVTCVNALSEWLEVEVKRDGKVHHMRFKRGKTASKLEVIGKAKGTGTKVTFKADSEIFPVIEYKYDILANRLRELAFLNRGIEISLKDERTNKQELFKFNGGIEEFIKHINRAKEPLHPKVIYVEKEKDGITAEVALQYNEGYNESRLQLRQQHQHHRRRHAPQRVPQRADPRHQPVRQGQQPAQGKGPDPRRRRSARRPDGRHQRQGAQPAV